MKKFFILLMLLLMIPFSFAASKFCVTLSGGSNVCFVGNGTINASNVSGGGGGTTYYAGQGLVLSAYTFSINESYRLPQVCSDGQIATWNATSGDWSTCTTAAGSGTVTSVTRGIGFMGNGTSITTTGTLNVNSSGLDCEAITGSGDLCDGSDNSGTDIDPNWLANYTLHNGSWSSTYNATYHSHTQDNTSWNESHANTLYLTSFTEVDPNWASNYSLHNASWSTDTNYTYSNGSGLNLNNGVYSAMISWFTENCAAITGSSELCDGDDATGGGGGGTSLWTDNGTWLNPNGSYAKNIVVSGYIKANNWSNVTVTESQISDFGSYLESFTEVDPNWASNYSAYNGSWSSTYNATYHSHTQDNTSWNESHARTIFSLIGEGGNSSWNESHADTLYYSISNPWSFINFTLLSSFTDDLGHIEDNTSWNQVAADSRYLQSYTENDPNWLANLTLHNGTWSTTYNATYHSHTQDNTSWSEVYARSYFYSTLNPAKFINDTNVAYVNNSNTFAENQTFSKNISVAGLKIVSYNSSYWCIGSC